MVGTYEDLCHSINVDLVAGNLNLLAVIKFAVTDLAGYNGRVSVQFCFNFMQFSAKIMPNNR